MRVALGRRYSLAASHRLFRPEWDEARNREEFGKCANPHGHGHNYVIEVSVTGEPDPVTGMVADLVALDRVVKQEVLSPFDHQNLNTLPAFQDRVPTSENFCIEIYDRLACILPQGLLAQVRVEETLNNSFTYKGAAVD